MYFPPVSDDPAEQQRANEAAGKAVTGLVGVGGIIAGFVLAMLHPGWPSVGLSVGSAGLLYSVNHWPKSWQPFGSWELIYAASWLVWISSYGLLIT